MSAKPSTRKRRTNAEMLAANAVGPSLPKQERWKLRQRQARLSSQKRAARELNRKAANVKKRASACVDIQTLATHCLAYLLG